MRDFSKAKRVVVKIGTNTLTKDGMLDTGYVRRIVGQISCLLEGAKEVLIITSGAIAIPIDAQLGETETNYILNHSGAETIICSMTYYKLFAFRILFLFMSHCAEKTSSLAGSVAVCSRVRNSPEAGSTL